MKTFTVFKLDSQSWSQLLKKYPFDRNFHCLLRKQGIAQRLMIMFVEHGNETIPLTDAKCTVEWECMDVVCLRFTSEHAGSYKVLFCITSYPFMMLVERDEDSLLFPDEVSNLRRWFVELMTELVSRDSHLDWLIMAAHTEVNWNDLQMCEFLLNADKINALVKRCLCESKRDTVSVEDPASKQSTDKPFKNPIKCRSIEWKESEKECKESEKEREECVMNHIPFGGESPDSAKADETADESADESYRAEDDKFFPSLFVFGYDPASFDCKDVDKTDVESLKASYKEAFNVSHRNALHASVEAALNELKTAVVVEVDDTAVCDYAAHCPAEGYWVEYYCPYHCHTFRLMDFEKMLKVLSNNHIPDAKDAQDITRVDVFLQISLAEYLYQIQKIFLVYEDSSSSCR